MISSLLSAQTPTQQTSSQQAGSQQAPAQTATQQSSSQPGPVETIKARTQVVLLDVVATDHGGHPVTDLKREDFTVFEQGKQQQVASFNLVDVAKRSLRPPDDSAQKLPPGVFTNRKDVVAEEGELTVLLLDALNTPWAHQSYARYEMLKYLQKNHPTGHTAVYALNTRLMRLQDFTDDPEVLKRAINNHKGQTSPLLPDSIDNAMPIGDLPEATQAAIQSFEDDQASFQMDMRERMTLDALKAIARQLAGYAGRKKLIWVSGGFPVNLEPGDNAGFSSQRNYADDITATTSLLRASQVSVYPVDAAGLQGPAVFDASTSGRGRNGRVMSGPQLSSQMSKDNAQLTATHFAAQQIASETGGLAFYNRNDLDTAISKSVADGAIYYALSYSPENKNWDNKVRKIEVKVNRPGVELRYRKSYVALDPEMTREQGRATVVQDIGAAMNTVLTSSAMEFYGSAQELRVPAKTGETANPAAPKLADVRFLVEPKDVIFQPNGDKHHCNIEFVVGVFEGDKMVKTTDKQIDGNLEAKRYNAIMKDGMWFQMEAEVVPGKQRMRLLVRDNISGKMGTVDLPYPPVLPAAASVKPAGEPTQKP